MQRVFFRIGTRTIARKLGLVGFVKNLYDGRVEVIAEGGEEKLKELIDYCKRGPILARVENVEIKYRNPSNKFNNFEISY